MSRDFTPRELTFADHQFHLSESKTTLSLQGTGDEVILYDPDSEMARAYPKLSFLLDGFRTLYEMSLTDEAMKNKLASVEKELEAMIQEDLAQPGRRGHVISSEHTETLVYWYTGTLDPGFYYNERNNQLFIDWLLEKEKKYEE